MLLHSGQIEPSVSPCRIEVKAGARVADRTTIPINAVGQEANLGLILRFDESSFVILPEDK
jgi:hypothetical protein